MDWRKKGSTNSAAKYGARQLLVAALVFSRPFVKKKPFFSRGRPHCCICTRGWACEKTPCIQINSHLAHLLTAPFFSAFNFSRLLSCSPLLFHSRENPSPDSGSLERLKLIILANLKLMPICHPNPKIN